MTEEITEEKATSLPAISIVMAANDHVSELEHHLPLFLEQDYPAGYEIIVVVGKGDDGTDDLLESMRHKHANLYTTFVPSSSRYMSRKKLAVTLGVKAAKNEWILLTEPECAPASPDWLRLMAGHCEESVDMVMGYSNYSDEASAYKRYERAMYQRRLLNETSSIAYRSDGHNLLFRKSMFMQGRGYDGNAQYVCGEYDFIVNKYATRGNTVAEQSPGAWLIENAPTQKKWNNRHLFYMCTRKSLRRSFRHRLPFNAIQTLKHLWYVVLLAAIVVAGLMQQWIFFGIAAMALVCGLIVHAMVCKKLTEAYDLGISAFKALVFDLSYVWRALCYKIKYLKADKYEFTSHRL